MSAVTTLNTSFLVNGEWVPLESCPHEKLPLTAVRATLFAATDTETDDAISQMTRNIFAQHRAQQHEHFLAWVEEAHGTRPCVMR